MLTGVKTMDALRRGARSSLRSSCIALGLASLGLQAFGVDPQRASADGARDVDSRGSWSIRDEVDSKPVGAAWSAARVGQAAVERADAATFGPSGAVVLTQSTNPNTVESALVACFDVPNNCTHEAEYARSFDLSVDPTAGQGHFVRFVTYGVGNVSDPSGFSPVTINLYLDPNGGAPDIANLVLLESIVDQVPDGTAGALRTVDFTPDQVLVPANATLVVSVLSEDLCSSRGLGHTYFEGGNDDGQTAPSYIRRPDPSCNNPDFVTLASIGNPFQHMVLTVTLDPQLICPAGSQFSQPPVPPTGTLEFHVSDQDAGIQLFDDFSGVAQPIEAVTWWGDQADLTIPDSCIDSPALFDITFYQDNLGAPGTVECSYTGVSVVPFDTGIDFDAGGGFLVDIIRFGAALLPSPCNLASGWISIEGLGGAAGCLFRWASATEPGMGSALVDDGVTVDPLGVDLSFCFPVRPDRCTVGNDTCHIGDQDTNIPCSRNSDCEPKTFEADANVAIPDDDPVGLMRTITVPDSFSIDDLDVGLVVEHPWVGDLIVTLEHNATTISLLDRTGQVIDPFFGCSTTDFDIVLDDEGTGGTVEDICLSVAPLDLTPTSPPNYTPDDLLSTFDTVDALGDWTLTISDNAPGDLGSLVRWSLNFPTTDNGVCGLKSRYATVTCGTGTRVQSIKVTIIDLDDALGFDAREDESWWVGPSQVVPNAPLPDLVGAPLVCEPSPSNAEVWAADDLHLFGGALVPGSLYEVRVCDEFGQICSTGFEVETGKWGDVKAIFGGGAQPDFVDISAIVDKFRPLGSAPDTSRTDLRGGADPGNPNVADGVSDFKDISIDVDAFSGDAYPFTVPACP